MIGFESRRPKIIRTRSCLRANCTRPYQTRGHRDRSEIVSKYMFVSRGGE